MSHNALRTRELLTGATLRSCAQAHGREVVENIQGIRGVKFALLGLIVTCNIHYSVEYHSVDAIGIHLKVAGTKSVMSHNALCAWELLTIANVVPMAVP
jgi:hypothetical protein